MGLCILVCLQGVLGCEPLRLCTWLYECLW